MKHRAKQAMTPEQKIVIDRLMDGALKTWDVDIIKDAVESGARTQELLTRAIQKQNVEFVKLALQYGADPNALIAVSDRKFQPVLHVAHENYHEEIFNTILAAGVSIDTQNPQGETVVQRAARAGDFARMRTYLAKGADLAGNAQEVLVKAIDKKDIAAMQWSVEHGADVQGRIRASGDASDTLLHVAFANFREDVMDYLLQQGVKIDARNSAGETVLHLAARGADPKKVEYLLKKGADPLATTYGGVSVLDEAMKALADSTDRWSSGSSRQRDAKSAVTLLLGRVKEVYGLEPYNTAVQRDFTVSKPFSVSGRKDEPPKTGGPGPA